MRLRSDENVKSLSPRAWSKPLSRVCAQSHPRAAAHASSAPSVLLPSTAPSSVSVAVVLSAMPSHMALASAGGQRGARVEPRALRFALSAAARSSASRASGSAAAAASAASPPAHHSRTTVILFSVSVPVLSEQMLVVAHRLARGEHAHEVVVVEHLLHRVRERDRHRERRPSGTATTTIVTEMMNAASMCSKSGVPPRAAGGTDHTHIIATNVAAAAPMPT